MPEIRLQSQWYHADAHAERPPPALDALPEGVWELPATPGALRQEISRLQNSAVCAMKLFRAWPSKPIPLTETCAGVACSIQVHLERSNAELAAEDPEDPDFKEAIAENEVILVAQRYKIQQCELRLQQLGGDSAPHDDGDDVEVTGCTDISAAEGSELPDGSSPTPEISAGDQADSPPIVPVEAEPEPEPELAADEGLYL